MKLVDFILSLLHSHAKESSKRFIALGTMALVTYVVIRFTDHNNAEYILAQLLGFVLLLVGVTVVQDISNKRKNETGPNQTIE